MIHLKRKRKALKPSIVVSGNADTNTDVAVQLDNIAKFLAIHSLGEHYEQFYQSSKSHFSAINGTSVRHVYSEDGKSLLGIVYKESKGRYRVQRLSDGKVRHKETLEAAYKTIRRAN